MCAVKQRAPYDFLVRFLAFALEIIVSYCAAKYFRGGGREFNVTGGVQAARYASVENFVERGDGEIARKSVGIFRVANPF